MAAYGYALGDEAVRVFTGLSAKQRGKVMRELDHLARFPAQKGDFHETGASGRTYEVKLCGDLLLTWWVDHAAREVRLVRLELVD
jgi:hypothetical protein